MVKSSGSNRTAISRRSLLRGIGVSLSLPLLNAMAPLASHAQAPAKPRRMFGTFQIAAHPIQVIGYA